MNAFYTSHMGLLDYLASEFRTAAQFEAEPDRFEHLANQVEHLMNSLRDATGNQNAAA